MKPEEIMREKLALKMKLEELMHKNIMEEIKEATKHGVKYRGRTNEN